MLKPRPNPRRARAAILIATLGVVLGQLGAGLLMDRAPLAVRFPDAANMLAMAEALPRTPEIVFLGSSRFGSSIDTAVIEQTWHVERDERVTTFNASVAAGDPVAMQFSLDLLLDRGIDPRLVVIEISPETVARRNPWIDAHIARQFTWADIAGALPDILRAKRQSKLLRSRLIPVHFFRTELRDWIGLAMNDLSRAWRTAATLPASDESEALIAPLAAPVAPPLPAPQGPDPNPLLTGPPAAGVDPAQASAAGAERVRKWLRDYDVGGISADSLEAILNQCKTRGIEAVLVAVPVTGGHRVHYSPDIEAKFDVHVRDLGSRFGVGYIDCRDWLGDDLFRDNHHTTAGGARVFSDMLARRLR